MQYIPIITFLSLIFLISSAVIENEDQCLRRPNYNSDEPFYFAPAIRAKLKKLNDAFSFPSRCFKKNIVTYKQQTEDTITLTLESSGKKELICTDFFIFHSSNLNKLQLVLFNGKHDITFKKVSQNDFDEILVNGIKVYSLCTDLTKALSSLLTTLKAFLGGLGYDTKALLPIQRPYIPEYQIEANLRLLKVYNNYIPLRRENKIVNFDKNIIKTGDFVGISRMDGLDPLIMVGAGGRTGHTAVCSWIDNELYVLESQDGWYWPTKGIQRTKWEQWVEWAYNADYNVVILPLREEYRKKLNVEKANEWFINVAEGLPYGYHNFIFSWIDTVDKNFPFIVTHEIVEFLFSIISYVKPDITNKFVTDGINKRLNVENLSFQEAIAEGARQGKSFEELLAMPEKEEYVYSDGLNYVCSSFVVAFYKHGGMFGDLEIEPNEFADKDVYSMDIFDKNFEKPKECVEDNPNLPYCQLMGKFVLELDDYSTIKPYSHMNERCSSMGPDFVREDGC